MQSFLRDHLAMNGNEFLNSKGKVCSLDRGFEHEVRCAKMDFTFNPDKNQLVNSIQVFFFWCMAPERFKTPRSLLWKPPFHPRLSSRRHSDASEEF
jgi:hypothetical protein